MKGEQNGWTSRKRVSARYILSRIVDDAHILRDAPSIRVFGPMIVIHWIGVWSDRRWENSVRGKGWREKGQEAGERLIWPFVNVFLISLLLVITRPADANDRQSDVVQQMGQTLAIAIRDGATSLRFKIPTAYLVLLPNRVGETQDVISLSLIYPSMSPRSSATKSTAYPDVLAVSLYSYATGSSLQTGKSH